MIIPDKLVLPATYRTSHKPFSFIQAAAYNAKSVGAEPGRAMTKVYIQHTVMHNEKMWN